MKRTLTLLVAGLFLGIFVLSSNSKWMKAVAQYRYSPLTKLPADKYRFGDLFGFSFLPAYKQKGFDIEDVKPYYVKEHAPNAVQLYSICDSYLWAFMPNDSLLRHAAGYRFARLDYDAKQFHLDSTKQNILILEAVERRVRSTMQDTSYIYRHLSVVDAVSKEKEGEIAPPSSWVDSYLFNKNIEANLEFNLFDYPFFTPFKELKAQLNYYVFNRTSQDVVVSKTRRQLYYASTVDSATAASSFKQLPEKELTGLVASLNNVYSHYRRAGFKQVYLVIMPNPVTILEPNLSTYNRLIPRIQRHPALKMPVIDVYSKLKHYKNNGIYQVADTHWDKNGFLLGVAQIDSVLATHTKL